MLDIVKAMEDAHGFVEDLTFQELEDDLRTQYALQRAFEIIGEATKSIDHSLQRQYPDVPWKQMAGMRDMLIHKYFAVNMEVVWETIHHDFPNVQPQLRRILEDLPE